MKIKIIYFVAICCLACKKEAAVFKTASTINVINAAIDVGSVKVNTTGVPISYGKTTDIVNYSSSKLYFAELGERSIVAVAATDTTRVLFNNILNMQPGFYTMCLAGQVPNLDTLFRRETDFPIIKTDITIPPITDHVTNLRFINLSPNSPTLKINIRNNIINELENFGYKSIGGWKRYDNKASGTTNYIFEIRNAATNAILTTYTFGATTANRFKNVSLVIKGLAGTNTGTNAFGVFPVNYF